MASWLCHTLLHLQEFDHDAKRIKNGNRSWDIYHNGNLWQLRAMTSPCCWLVIFGTIKYILNHGFSTLALLTSDSGCFLVVRAVLRIIDVQRYSWLLRTGCQQHSPNPQLWPTLRHLMIQSRCWSSSHHSYLQKVGWKQKTKGIHQGVLLEATTQSFHSHPTGQNLATGHT